MTKREARKGDCQHFRHSSFGFPSPFVIRHSSFT
jgi:hypothetical protein